MAEKSEAADALGKKDASAATVLELMPSGMVRVELASRQQVLAHPAGVKEKNFVRLRPGDRVSVEVSPLDPGRGRITSLLRKL